MEREVEIALTPHTTHTTKAFLKRESESTSASERTEARRSHDVLQLTNDVRAFLTSHASLERSAESCFEFSLYTELLFTKALSF